MSPQREFLLSLPQLNLGFLKPHGTPGVYSGDSNEVYVLLRLPRGGHNLVLNRHYHAIGFLSPKDALALRAKLAPIISSKWEGDYNWGAESFLWKNSIWYGVHLSACPHCGHGHAYYSTNGNGYVRRCGKCGIFRKQWKS